MYRKPNSLVKQLVAAAAFGLGASGVALADDNTMNPINGESYKYFNGSILAGPGQFNRPVFSKAPADPSWRQSHPNGLTEREMQALSASDLSVFVAQINPPVFASAPADPSWRQSHPNGLTEPELQALSASSLSMWQDPSGSRVAAGQTNVAQSPNKETLSARLARFFHPAT